MWSQSFPKFHILTVNCKNSHYGSKVHTGHIALLCVNSKPCGCKDHNVLCSFDNTKFHFQLQLFRNLYLQVLSMKRGNLFFFFFTVSTLDYLPDPWEYILAKKPHWNLGPEITSSSPAKISIIGKFVPCEGLKNFLVPLNFYELFFRGIYPAVVMEISFVPGFYSAYTFCTNLQSENDFFFLCKATDFLFCVHISHCVSSIYVFRKDTIPMPNILDISNSDQPPIFARSPNVYTPDPWSKDSVIYGNKFSHSIIFMGTIPHVLRFLCPV